MNPRLILQTLQDHNLCSFLFSFFVPGWGRGRGWGWKGCNFSAFCVTKVIVGCLSTFFLVIVCSIISSYCHCCVPDKSLELLSHSYMTCTETKFSFLFRLAMLEKMWSQYFTSY